jgi:hypothetical protein
VEAYIPIPPTNLTNTTSKKNVVTTDLWTLETRLRRYGNRDQNEQTQKPTTKIDLG